MKKLKDLKKYQKQRIVAVIVAILLIVAMVFGITSIKKAEYTNPDEIKNFNYSYRTVIFIGSDFTRGTRAKGNSFVDYLESKDAEILSITGKNLKMVKHGNKPSYITLFDEVVNTKELPRAVFYELSYYDKNSKIGKITETMDKNDFDTKTVYGAMEYTAYMCRNVLGCPMIVYTCPNNDSKKYQKLIDVAQEVCDKWNMNFVNFCDNDDFKLDKKQKRKYMSSKICPKKEGYKKLFNPYFEKYIKAYYPDILDKDYIK